jgi:hypothetical protein
LRLSDGFAAAVACGFKTTVIATGPFKPLLPFQVRERARLDLAREAQSERLYQLAHEDVRVPFVLSSIPIFALVVLSDPMNAAGASNCGASRRKTPKTTPTGVKHGASAVQHVLQVQRFSTNVVPAHGL